MSTALTVHASCIVMGEAGFLLRGASGSGKSTLAAALIDEAHMRGAFAELVGDDRIVIEPRHGRLVARSHPAIPGLIERRGFGVVRGPFERACVLRCVVDLDPGAHARLPEAEARRSELGGVWLPQITARDWLQAAALIRAFLATGESASNDLFETSK